MLISRAWAFWLNQEIKASGIQKANRLNDDYLYLLIVQTPSLSIINEWDFSRSFVRVYLYNCVCACGHMRACVHACVSVCALSPVCNSEQPSSVLLSIGLYNHEYPTRKSVLSDCLGLDWSLGQRMSVSVFCQWQTARVCVFWEICITVDMCMCVCSRVRVRAYV